METFDTKLEKSNQLSPDKTHISKAIRFLKTATSGNDQLLHASACCDMIKETNSPGVAPTNQEYYTFVMCICEKLEYTVIDNSTGGKVNVARLDFLHPYSPDDDNYDEATELSLYMGARGIDINIMYDI